MSSFVAVMAILLETRNPDQPDGISFENRLYAAHINGPVSTQALFQLFGLDSYADKSLLFPIFD